MGLIGGISSGLLLNERITLRAPTRVRDGSGGWTNTYADQATVNGAAYVTLRSTFLEAMEGDAPTSEIRSELVLDAIETVPDPAWRAVQADGTTWELIAVSLQGTLAYCTGRKVS